MSVRTEPGTARPGDVIVSDPAARAVNVAAMVGEAARAEAAYAEHRSGPLVAVARIAVVLVPLLLWYAPLPLEPQAQHTLAIGSFMIVSWVTRAIDYAIAGLIGCYLFWALGVVPVQVAFSGFASDTPWFVFGLMLLGTMVTKSGLGRRLAFLVMRAVGTTYSRLLLGLILSDLVLIFILPSAIARLVVLAAIAAGLMKAFDVGPGSNIGRGMFIMITYTASIFDKMILVGPAAITATGIMEKVGGVHISWTQWLLAYLPCSLLTVLVAWRLALWLYPPENVRVQGGRTYLADEVAKLGPWTSIEVKSGLLMLTAVALWMTDSFHGMPASIVGLGVGLLATLPGVGVLTTDDVRKMNYLLVVFVAAAASMGQVLVATHGIDVLTTVLFSWMQPFMHNLYTSALVLYWAGFGLHLFLGNEISMLASSMPGLMIFAKSHGLDPLAIGMIWTFAAGGKVFVYQSTILIIGYSYGYFDERDLFKVGLALTIIESLFLLGLVPFYWPLLGIG
jgi:anion transporter